MKKLCTVILLIFTTSFAERLINSGHGMPVRFLDMSDTYLLSNDYGNWILWDRAEHDMLGKGFADEVKLLKNMIWTKSLGEHTPIGSYPDTICLLSISSLDIITKFPYDVTSGFSIDNKCCWYFKDSTFVNWYETGDSIAFLNIKMENIQSYSDTVLYTSNDSLFHVVLPENTKSFLGTFSGTFSKWFIDGEYFLTTQGNIVRLYSKDGVFKKIVEFPTVENLNGSSGHFWAHNNPSNYDSLIITDVSSTNSNIMKYHTGTSASIIPTESKIAILQYGDQQFRIVHLEDSVILISEENALVPYLYTFATDKTGDWVVSNKDGVIESRISNINGKKFYGYGKIRSIAGSNSSIAAVATATREVLIYDFNIDTVNPVKSLAINASTIQLSRNGEVLAVRRKGFDGYNEDRHLYIYSLKNDSIIRKWEYDLPDSNGYLWNFKLAMSGNLMALYVSENYYRPFLFKVDSVFSGVSTFSNLREETDEIFLSPDGNYIMIESQENEIVKLYENGALANAFTGMFNGWIYDSRFCIDSIIYNTDGNTIDTLSITDISSITILPDSLVFIHGANHVLNENLETLYNGEDGNYISVGKYRLLSFNDTAVYVHNWKEDEIGIIAGHDKSNEKKVTLNSISYQANILSAKFNLPNPAKIKILLYSLNGRIIKTENTGYLNSGNYLIKVPLNKLSKGIYIASFQFDNNFIRKTILVK